MGEENEPEAENQAADKGGEPLHNLKLAVEAVGGTVADIVKLNYYVVAELDQATVPKLRPIRDRRALNCGPEGPQFSNLYSAT